jgi:hypothetical protein
MYQSASRRLILSARIRLAKAGIMSVDQFFGTPRLVVVYPERLRGQVLDISDRNVLVGRGRDPRFVLDDPRVSRTHAAISRAGDGVLIEDLGSAGGTKVNGIPAIEATQLRNGDIITLATVKMRYESAQQDHAETQVLSAQPATPMFSTQQPAQIFSTQSGAPQSAAPQSAAPPPRTQPPQVHYDVGQQHGGVISNVGGNQYNAYVHQVQQRESFLREIAGTKTKARILAWLGFIFLVLGMIVYGATILRFIKRIGPNTDPNDVQLLGPDVAGVPVGVYGLAAVALGSVLLIVGIVLHVSASAKRRRVDREVPLPYPPPPY